ncbi:MAG: alpha/beta fold hydrolase [Bacteroidota bacterium]|nr:alpha/beta fold hydrolase [Bacteroidota bacterium]
MPLINSAFAGNSFSTNAHLETLTPALFRKVLVKYKRERLNLEDGDFMDLDWVQQNNKKLLVMFHGLEGSSESQYMKGFALHFGKQQYDICAVNFRSCSGEHNRLLKSYHNGSTPDIHEVLQHISKTNNYQVINLAGFSLGGNVLLKYLGDGVFNLNPKIKSAVVFSVPIDLAGCTKQLAKFSNKVYMLGFLDSLNHKLKEKAALFPGSLNLSGLSKIKTFTEWDNRFTAPIHGFKDAADYYRQCSSKQFLKNIKIPTLLVNAKNDPFLSKECYLSPEDEISPVLHFESPKCGGHVGFSLNLPNGNYYSEARASHFFEEHA